MQSGSALDYSFFAVVVLRKVHPAPHHFFQSNARVFVFQRIDVDARAGAALQLFASLGGENNQTILRIDFRRLRLFCNLFSLFLVAIMIAPPLCSNKNVQLELSFVFR